MPDYSQLRQMVSHRVTFDFDTGAKVTGTIGRCLPDTGPVQLVTLNRVEVMDADGEVLEHHESFSMVPNSLVDVRITEGPLGRDS